MSHAPGSPSAPPSISAPEPSESLIFVVDDEPAVLSGLTKWLQRAGYQVEAFTSPTEALVALPDRGPALLITDKEMPVMNGLDLAKACLEADPDLAVIILTGFAEVRSATAAVRLGIEDYLVKPPDLKELGQTVQRAIWRRASRLYSREMEAWHRRQLEEQSAELRRQKDELEKVSVGALSALTRALEARNPYFKGHSGAVADLAARMAGALGWPEDAVEKMRAAGLLHDIGMVAVPDALLQKEGPLTRDELASLRQHPVTGAEILGPFPHLAEAVDWVRYHHERLDGSGYPDGLAGEAIPEGAQILALAEAYVAITEDRSWRSSLSPSEAFSTLAGAVDVWFSKRALEALREALRRRE